MGRRKGEDTLAAKRRRMPYVAKLRREDPFKPDDAREVEAACRRVAAASEFMVLAGWREDSGYRVYRAIRDVPVGTGPISPRTQQVVEATTMLHARGAVSPLLHSSTGGRRCLACSGS